jgi:uncharacterized protein (DUF1697 family)
MRRASARRWSNAPASRRTPWCSRRPRWTRRSPTIGFYLDGADRAPFEALRRECPDEAFALGAHACYLWCPDGILESRIGEALGGSKFRDRVTARNWATTLKLQALAASKT